MEQEVLNNPSARVGYVRVSSADQNTDRQLAGIELNRVFEDKVSGKTADRPQLEEMLKYVRAGDEVFVHSMDRLARNLEDLLRIIHQLMDKGVRVRFVKESLSFDPKTNADPMSKLILSVMGAVAEFERSLILERQREGIALAKARGAYKGRARKGTPELLEKARNLLYAGKDITETAKILGVSRGSLYRWFAEAGEPLVKQYKLKGLQS